MTWCSLTPTAKQDVFLQLRELEALYGGAAGPGKSVALLMAALQYVHVPGYAALLLRRTYSDLSLPGALMDKANVWLRSTAAHWGAETKTWTFPNGATVSFGFLQNTSDKYRYQSSEFQFIGFDELTQFPEADYTFLFSRLRRLKSSDVPLRMRAASNPGNIGHEWVNQRFMVESHPDRIFIPASLDDNPYLDREEYVKSLAELDPITRQQLLKGDWSARQAGGMFNREWFEIVEIPPVEMHRVRYWDMAASEVKKGTNPDWTVGALVGHTGQGLIYVCDIARLRGTPQQAEAMVKQAAEVDGKGVRICMEEEGGSSGKTVISYYARKVLFGWSFAGVGATGTKEVRAQPVSSQAEAGNIKLVRGRWIGPFLDELELFPNGDHDDQVDALSGAISQLAMGGWRPA